MREETAVGSGCLKMKPKVAIIILSWNGKQWLVPCLDSVLKTEYENFHIYAVDNGSNDGSQTLIRDKYPSVTLIQNNKNLGFAGGNNVGIRRALKDRADYIMLLNQDTKVDPGWLGPLVEAAEADPTIGILSPMQLDYEGKKLDPSFRSLLENDTSYEEDLRAGSVASNYDTTWVVGAAMIMRRSVCERVGLFDPLYFAYAEESDLCRRARYHRFRIMVVTSTRIFHNHTLSSQNQKKRMLPYLFVRNQALHLWKNPEFSIWTKIKHYIRWDRYKYSFQYTGWPRDLRHRWCIVSIHLWLLSKLPLILWRTLKERQGPMYLVSD